MKSKNIATIVLFVLAGLVVWSIVGSAAILTLNDAAYRAVTAKCSPLHETIVYEGNSVTIVGEVTPEIKKACTRLWQERQGFARDIVNGELSHIRTLAVEEAKIEVLGRLERLKAANIYVRSSSSSNTVNSVTNTVANDLRATQTVR